MPGSVRVYTILYHILLSLTPEVLFQSPLAISAIIGTLIYRGRLYIKVPISNRQHLSRLNILCLRKFQVTFHLLFIGPKSITQIHAGKGGCCCPLLQDPRHPRHPHGGRGRPASLQTQNPNQAYPNNPSLNNRPSHALLPSLRPEYLLQTL